MLKQMSEHFEQKVPEDYNLCVNFEVESEGDEAFEWHLSCGGGRAVWGPGHLTDVDVTFSMDRDTLGNVYSGKWSGLTAAGRAHLSESAPLDFNTGRPNSLKRIVRLACTVVRLFIGHLRRFSISREFMRSGYYFLSHFFSAETPTRVRFGAEHTRRIHGGDAAALFYHPGLRSAYYMVRPGQVLNEDGAKDPMHQCFILISGQGAVTICDKESPARPGEAIYIPPGTVHMLRPEGDEPVEIIWLAWGESA